MSRKISKKRGRANTNTRRRVPKGRSNPTGGREVSPTILRWIERFGEFPNYTSIARAIGVSPEAVSRVMYDEAPWEPTQATIAKYARWSVGELFGDAAWFRQAGRELSRRRERRAS